MTRKIFLVVFSVILALLTLLIAYILYLQVTDYKPDTITKLTVEGSNGNNDKLVKPNTEMTAVTSNVGFGAYDHAFQFFMDGGTESRAASKENVIKNITGIGNAIKKQNPNFILLQEVDIDSTRSYHVNQYDVFKNIFKGYNSSFGVNFNVKWIAYPFLKPHGRVLAGQPTFSDFKVASSERLDLPVDESWPKKLFFLDRCVTVSKLPVENGKELVILNSHLSAYDKGGKIRKKQLAVLKNFLEEEYNKGNYVVIGGDWNHEIPGINLDGFTSKDPWPNWLKEVPKEFNPKGFKWYADSKVPTCRDAGKPYVKGDNFVCVIDGFMVSDNIDVTDVRGLNLDFKYSDHNPVMMKFKLK
ncbi:endonuclease [Clostridiaceae bacterium 14S0207]|nr:endonuclease [Clostridiaceae bacterium 14S0207]